MPATNSAENDQAASPRKAKRPPRDHVPTHRRRYNPTSHRLREIERVIKERQGYSLDTDDADIYLVPVAQVLRRFQEIKTGSATAAAVFERMKIWARHRVPLIGEDVLRDAAIEAVDNPGLDRAEVLARRLRLTLAERDALNIRTIGAYDVSKAERTKRRKARTKAHDRLRKAAERRQRGEQPRAQYLAENHLSRTQPWKIEGVSRATWYRRQRKAQADTTPEPVRQVLPPTVTDSPWLDGLVSRHNPTHLPPSPYLLDLRKRLAERRAGVQDGDNSQSGKYLVLGRHLMEKIDSFGSETQRNQN